MAFSFQLNLLNEQKKLKKQRQDQAAGFYQEGIEYLSQAQGLGFEAPEYLQLATQAFLRTIQISPDFHLAYLGQAYIFMILEQALQAKDYVRQVLAQAPTFSAAQEFLLKIHQELYGENTLSYTAHELNQYEQLEQDIYRTCLALTQRPPPEIATSSAQLETLEREFQLDQKQWQRYQEQFQILEVDFNTALLQKSLEPLENLIKSEGKILRISKGFLGLIQLLHTEIRALKTDLKALLKSQLPSEIEDFELKLEHYFDRAELLGDKLNDLAEQGFRSKEAESVFQELKLYLDIFNQLLEERLEGGKL